VFTIDGSNCTFNAGTGTIEIQQVSGARTFTGGGKTYNLVWFHRGPSTATTTIAGSNTFAEFRDTGIAAHTLAFTNGTTQTIAKWSVSGNVGRLITITSDTTATHALVYNGPSIVSSNFLNIQHSVATPASTWYAGINSVNNQATPTGGSGWIFTGLSPSNFLPFM